MAFTKPSDLIGTTALQSTLVVGDIQFSKGEIGFTGLGQTFKLASITNVKTTAYSAGVLQITKVDFAGATVVAGNIYTLQLRRLDTNQPITYQVIATDTQTTTLCALFRTAILNDFNAIVSISTQTASFFTITEKSLDTKGFFVTGPSGTVVTYTGGGNAAHVDSSGTLPEVQVYVPTVTAGNYKKYDISFNKQNLLSMGGKVLNEVRVIVWANELDGGFAAFNDAVVGTTAGALGGILTGARVDDTSNATLKTTVGVYDAVI